MSLNSEVRLALAVVKVGKRGLLEVASEGGEKLIRDVERLVIEHAEKRRNVWMEACSAASDLGGALARFENALDDLRWQASDDQRRSE